MRRDYNIAPKLTSLLRHLIINVVLSLAIPIKRLIMLNFSDSSKGIDLNKHPFIIY